MKLQFPFMQLPIQFDADALAREVLALDESCWRARMGGVAGNSALPLVTTGGAVDQLGVDLAGVRGPLLAPGLGAQGAGPQDVAAVFAGATRSVVPTSSRAVLGAGPDEEALATAARSVNAMLKPLRSRTGSSAKA